MAAIRIANVAGWAVLVLVVGTPLLAADWSQIALTRSAVQKDRQAIVAKFMELNESQSHAFWPVYRDYRAAIAAADDRMVTILEHLIDQHGVISDREADNMLDDYLTFEQERIRVQYEYLKRFRKILPLKQVARLFQLENKMDAVVRYELATKVPLVD